MPYSFPAFEHLADVGRAPSPAAGAPPACSHTRQLYCPRGQRGRGAPRRPGGLPHKRTSTQLAVENYMALRFSVPL